MHAKDGLKEENHAAEAAREYLAEQKAEATGDEPGEEQSQVVRDEPEVQPVRPEPELAPEQRPQSPLKVTESTAADRLGDVPAPCDWKNTKIEGWNGTASLKA
jgi:hypothetical protein